MTERLASDAPLLMLDTNIISDLMRHPQGKSTRRLQQLMSSIPDLKVCASLVADCEISFGLQRKPSTLLQQAYANLLQVVEILPLDLSTTSHYASIRAHLESLGTPIGPNDTLIAAHALALDCTLVTDNEAEFRRVPGLRVENWLKEGIAKEVAQAGRK
jgi:tRNA(fMet)-specific endonuclease VapC